MYPPREEPDSVRNERNRVQGIWLFATLWVMMGLFSIFARHDLLIGLSQITTGVAGAAGELTRQKAPKWRNLVCILYAVVFVVLLAGMFLRR